MHPEDLKRFEQSVRAHGDVEAALGELDKSQEIRRDTEELADRLRNTALQALLEEKAAEQKV